MTLLKYFTLLLLFVTIASSAQKKEITLEEIWDGTFRTERMDALHSMSNGKHYSVLNTTNKASQIDIYDYKTLRKVTTLLNSNDITDIEKFSNYTFSNDETKLLLATNVEPIFRRSTLGQFYVYDIDTKTTTLISEEKIQEPTFSPDGSKIAFGLNNNLYVKDLMTGKTQQITLDGKKNSIINGITDWVYEEEFSFVRAFEWNVDGSKIAFIRFDETDVPEFSMDIYGKNLYQTQNVFKYPKAGEVNSQVSLHIYNVLSNKKQEIKLNKAYNDYYIPRIKWTNEPNILSAQYTNRHQNELDLWMINAETLSGNLILAETDKAYIDVTFNLTFLKDNSFIWTSETNGWNHIYHYDKNGKLINQVTSGDWEVTNYYGFNQKSKRIFYQSTEDGSINRGIYSIGLNGKKKQRLTKIQAQMQPLLVQTSPISLIHFLVLLILQNTL